MSGAWREVIGLVSGCLGKEKEENQSGRGECGRDHGIRKCCLVHTFVYYFL